AQQRLQPRDATPRLAYLHHVGQLTGRRLEAQVEERLVSGLQVARQVFVDLRAQLVGVAASHQIVSSRPITLVLIGSLWCALRKASRAASSGTPATSNITRPRLTTATQRSTAP